MPVADLQIEVLTSPERWDEFSQAMPDECWATQLAGHCGEWIKSLEDGFGHSIYLLSATDSGATVGLLPLVFVRGPVFGKFLVSLPYLNTGGVWGLTPVVASKLVDAACDLADQFDVKHLELRGEQPIEHAKFNFERTEKVHMRLPLPETAGAFDKSLKSKVRSQVKKADEHDLAVEFGGAEKLDDFYRVFARNMRDLGTPVFSKKLFAAIIKHFDGNAEFCVVRKSGLAIAAGLITHVRGVSEVPSASSLREFNRTNANMLMYQQMIHRAIERGSSTFDFGRSSQGSGTYRFKAQWGAQPHPAVWQYYVRKGDPDSMRPDADGKKTLVQVWRKLPVWLTRAIGPAIVRGIP
ncbi:MAG: FemAB family XrtA/PEP-CTERM system-associated protein [Rubripirellula sp.]